MSQYNTKQFLILKLRGHGIICHNTIQNSRGFSGETHKKRINELWAQHIPRRSFVIHQNEDDFRKAFPFIDRESYSRCYLGERRACESTARTIGILATVAPNSAVHIKAWRFRFEASPPCLCLALYVWRGCQLARQHVFCARNLSQILKHWKALCCICGSPCEPRTEKGRKAMISR